MRAGASGVFGLTATKSRERSYRESETPFLGHLASMRNIPDAPVRAPRRARIPTPPPKGG
jgi:hypothetical protein